MKQNANSSKSFRLVRNQNDTQKNSIPESRAPQNDNYVIVIAGPTASGKTAMAVKLAKEINGEVINADSRSIYKGMDLGTGKPTLEERGEIPHHLFDIINPDETFSVADYKELAGKKIKEILKNGKTPIITGGTGLYIDALVYDYRFIKNDEGSEIRDKLEEKILEELQREIEKIDPSLIKESEIKNKRRIIRALEIYYQTGEKKSEEKKPLPKNVKYFAIETEREKLYEKINNRVKEMFEKGLVNESKELLKKYKSDSAGLQTMGYLESIKNLNDEISLEKAITKTQQAHRNLAKRQTTWFKRNKDIVWVKDFRELKKYL